MHVEGLERRWIAVNDHRPVERAGDDGFFVAAKVVAKLCRIAVLVENGDGLFVADGGKGRLDGFEFFRVALKRFELARFVSEDGLDDRADEAFGERHRFVQFYVRGLWLKHPEFGEVPAGLRFFGAEGGTEGIDFSEGHGQGFAIELAALREISFLIVDVIDFEERGSAFASCGREHRRIGECVALAVHEFAGGADGFGADAEDGGLARRSNPQMAVVEQKIDAVLLELDGERGAFRYLLEDLNFGDADFVAARRPSLGTNISGDDNAGFLRKTLERFECFRIYSCRET